MHIKPSQDQSSIETMRQTLRSNLDIILSFVEWVPGFEALNSREPSIFPNVKEYGDERLYGCIGIYHCNLEEATEVALATGAKQIAPENIRLSYTTIWNTLRAVRRLKALWKITKIIVMSWGSFF